MAGPGGEGHGRRAGEIRTARAIGFGGVRNRLGADVSNSRLLANWRARPTNHRVTEARSIYVLRVSVSLWFGFFVFQELPARLAAAGIATAAEAAATAAARARSLRLGFV